MTYSLVRENRILSALLEVSKVLNSSFDLEKNLSRTMSVLGEFLEMERGSVFLLDDKTKELRIVAAHGLTKEQIARGKYRMGEGIIGRVLEKGSPMVIPNVGEEPLFLNKTGSRMKRDGISFLCVPITFKGESIGVLSADRIFKDNTITVDEDIRVLEIVASIIAQYAILWKHYKESEQEKENLRLELKGRYSLPNIVGSSDRMQEVFEAVHRVADSKATVILYGESGTGKENTIERLVIMTNKETITSSDLPINFKSDVHKGVLHNGSLRAGVEDMEKSNILTALEQSGWVQARAARMLGITSRQIGYKIKKYGINNDHPRSRL